MKPNDWYSGRLKQHIDLEKLPTSELIQEIFHERQEFIELEEELGQTSKK